MKRSESTALLAAALVGAQAKINTIPFDSDNPFFKSKYASLTTILETVRPILAEYKLALVQGASTPHTDTEGKVTAVSVETVLFHQSGEWVATDVVMPLSKSDAQGAGAAITYGRRYGISALLSLATDEDDDGNSASHRPAPKAHAAPTPKAAPAPARPAAAKPSGNANAHGDFLMPFGKTKNKTFAELGSEQVQSALAWVQGNCPDKFKEFQDAASKFLGVEEVEEMAGTSMRAGDPSDEMPF